MESARPRKPEMIEIISTKAAVTHIRNKNWTKFLRVVTSNPGILDVNLFLCRLEQPPLGFMPTILYFIQPYADGTEECKQALKFVMEKSNWLYTDHLFANTPFIGAIAMRNKHSIKMMFDFIRENKPDLLTQENREHSDAKNTPLLLAIKNGDEETALTLVPFYQEEDLLNLSKYGNSALHLACYKKMDRLIIAIIEQAIKLNCLDSVLNQKNSKGFLPLDLYQATIEGPKTFYWNDVIIEGRETHDYFNHFDEEFTKHEFGADEFGKKGEAIDIINLLIPASGMPDKLNLLLQDELLKKMLTQSCAIKRLGNMFGLFEDQLSLYAYLNNLIVSHQ